MSDNDIHTLLHQYTDWLDSNKRGSIDDRYHELVADFLAQRDPNTLARLHVMSEKEYNYRLLRFRLKRAHKNIGKQGETIHRLRAEIAEVRQLNSRLDRGELRRLDAGMDSARRMLDRAYTEIEQLKQKIELDEKLKGTTNLDELYDGQLDDVSNWYAENTYADGATKTTDREDAE